MIIKTDKALRPRQAYDHYPTHSGLVRAAYQMLPARPWGRVLDHSAGTGVWGAVAREIWPNVYLIGVEVQPCLPRPSYNEWYGGMDFLRYFILHHKTQQRPFDLIIGNPPYKWTEYFVRMSMSMLRKGGCCIQLLRTAFLEGQDRSKNFYPSYNMTDVGTCSRRPSFTGNRKTDATSYSVFLWEKGQSPPWYRGHRIDWNYSDPIPEDRPFDELNRVKLLTDSHHVLGQPKRWRQQLLFETMESEVLV